MRNKIVAVLASLAMIFGIGLVNASQASAAQFVIGSPGTIMVANYRYHSYHYAEAAPGVKLTYLSMTQYFQWGQRVKVTRKYLPDTTRLVWHRYAWPTKRKTSAGTTLSGRNSAPCLPGATPVRSILSVSAVAANGARTTSSVIGRHRAARC